MSSVSTQLRFWGVRGSLATGHSEYGSNTSCVELDLGSGVSLFFDAGTGIRAAGEGRKFEKVILFLSHFHWDHIQGLPYFSALEDLHCHLEIWTSFSDAEERLSVLFDNRFHPVSLDKYRKKISICYLDPQESFERFGLQVQTAPLNHPGTSYAMRIGGSHASFVYATDSDYEPLPTAATALLNGADWAVMDSQFLIGDSVQKASYGHASFKQAIDVCAMNQVKNCFLFHFDPNYSDEQLSDLERQAAEYREATYPHEGPQVQMAKEGLERRLAL